MKIEIDGNKFEIDIERAKELGICYPIGITKIKAGDVFERRNVSPEGGKFNSLRDDVQRIMIIQTTHFSKRYTIAGYDGLVPFSDYDRSHGLTEEKMIIELNKNNYEFVANINEEIEDLLLSCGPSYDDDAATV